VSEGKIPKLGELNKEAEAVVRIRDEKGRFVKGHPPLPGGGRPRARTRVMMDILRAKAEERFAKVIDALFAQAEKGNTKAAELVIKYILGLPPQARIDITDSELIDQIRELWYGKHGDKSDA